MNYIKEINAFYQRQETNQLSSHAANLWHTLMHINNRTGWKEQFTVAMGMLCAKGNLSNSTFKRARTELQEKGYIKWEARGANRAAMYEMVSLVEEFSKEDVRESVGAREVESDRKMVAARGVPEGATMYEEFGVETKRQVERELDGGNFWPKVQSKNEVDLGNEKQEFVCDPKVRTEVEQNLDHTPDPLFKQDKTKNIQTTTAAVARNFFEKNISKITPYIMTELSTWTDKLSEEVVVKAMERALERGKANWAYTKGILQAWMAKGFRTVAEVEAEVVAFREKGSGGKVRKRGGNMTSRREEVVPEWFKERKKELSVGEVEAGADDGSVSVADIIAKYA